MIFNRKTHGKTIEKKPWKARHLHPAWEISDIELRARLALSTTTAAEAAFATLDDDDDDGDDDEDLGVNWDAFLSI